jgi:hypothetical protein
LGLRMSLRTSGPRARLVPRRSEAWDPTRALLAACGVALLSGLLPGSALAHQPRLVGAATAVRVTEPEVSKAYYARLPGRPARYEITSGVPFTLYAQTTVPDVAHARRDLRMRILGPTGQLAGLTTPPSRWKPFYEPFGGDHYLTGPEFRRRVPAGRYTVEVSDPGNRGTYVLAIGEAEKWDPVEAARALAALPAIKHDYFGQSLPRAWLSRTIPIIALMLAGLVGAALLARRLIKRRRR